MSGPEESEPDHRFTLANERTFLAWLRTALALLAAGVAVVQLVPDFGIPAGRKVLGVLLAALAVLAAATSVLRWRQVDRAMRLSKPLPPTRAPWILAGVLALIAVLTLILLALAPQ